MNSLTRCLWVVSCAVVVGLTSGCAGVALDVPHNVQLERPVPLKGGLFDDRWACQSEFTEATAIASSDFVAAWGEPRERRLLDGEEHWRYHESWRWCGVWLFAIIPLPFALPVCSTYDDIYFTDGRATRADSRRFGGRFAGIVIAPYGPVPVPVLTRSGSKHENSAAVTIFPAPENVDYACPPVTPAVASVAATSEH